MRTTLFIMLMYTNYISQMFYENIYQTELLEIPIIITSLALILCVFRDFQEIFNHF